MAATYTVYPVGADLGQTPKYPGKYKNVNELSLCCESCFDIESPEDFESEIESLPSEWEGQFALVQTDDDGWTEIIKKACK